MDDRMDQPVPPFNARVEERDERWCLTSLADGRWRVLSRHSGRAAAEAALEAFTESARRDV